MQTDIFTVSYDDDAEWLHYCVRSVDKFAHDFRAYVVVLPEGHERAKAACAGTRATVVTVPHRVPGHMHQIALKLTADQFCKSQGTGPGADRIVFLDSDCVLTRHCNPRDWCHEGRPKIAIARYAWIQHITGEYVRWQHGTARALGVSPEHPHAQWDYMRTGLLSYPASLVEATRKRIEHVGRAPVVDVALRSWNTNNDFYPQNRYVGQPRGTPGFSEFNAMGLAARLWCPDWITWHNIEKIGHLEITHLRQFWSHAAPTQEQRDWLNQLLAS